MANEIYVTALGTTTKDVLNSMAIFFNSPEWATLYMSLAAISGIYTAYKFATTSDYKAIVSWVACITILPFLLIWPKTTVTINDVSNPMNIQVVDNVPAGVALPMVYITTAVYGVQQMVENVFHSNDDEQYNKTGMIYAANLFEASTQVSMSPETQELWNQYISNCIVPDIYVRKKYEWKQLFNTSDIYQFLVSNGSGGEFNRIYIKGVGDGYPTCKEALPIIKTKVDMDSKVAINMIAAQSFNPEASPNPMMAEQGINNMMSSFFGANSKTARETIGQNILIQGTKGGLLNNAVKSGSSAGALAFSVTQAEMASMAFYQTIGMQMTKVIPMMQTIFTLLIAVAFIPLCILLFLGYQVPRLLFTYAGSWLFITSWGIFYVFLNFIMNSIFDNSFNHLISMAHAGGGEQIDALTLSMQNEALHNTYYWMSMTGYLMMFIPYMARIITAGAANTMSTMATSMSNVAASNARLGSQAMATGDYNIGNTSWNNHNANNTNMNKFDDNQTHMSGISTRQDAFTGATMMQTSGSYGTITSQQDNLWFGSSATQGVSSSLQSQANQNYSAAMSSAKNFSEQYAQSHSSGNADTNSLGYQTSHALDTVQRVGSNYSESTTRSVSADVKAGLEIAGSGASTTLGGRTAADYGMTADDFSSMVSSLSVLDRVDHATSSNLDDRHAIDAANTFNSNMSSSISLSRVATDLEQKGSQSSTNTILSVKNEMLGMGWSKSDISDVRNQTNPQFMSDLAKAEKHVASQFMTNPSYDQAKAQILNNQSMQGSEAIDKASGNFNSQAKDSSTYGKEQNEHKGYEMSQSATRNSVVQKLMSEASGSQGESVINDLIYNSKPMPQSSLQNEFNNTRSNMNTTDNIQKNFDQQRQNMGNIYANAKDAIKNKSVVADAAHNAWSTPVETIKNDWNNKNFQSDDFSNIEKQRNDRNEEIKKQ